jgi:hypothetical protein
LRRAGLGYESRAFGDVPMSEVIEMDPEVVEMLGSVLSV